MAGPPRRRFSTAASWAGWRRRRWTARAGWSQRHTLALITGVLGFPILLLTLIPAIWPTLEPLATVPFLALLIALAVRLRPSHVHKNAIVEDGAVS